MNNQNQAQPMDLYVLQKSIFKNTVNKNLIEPILDKLNKDEWIIFDEDYKQYEYQKIFLHMVTCLAQEIKLDNNSNSNLIQQIKNIRFTNLKKLFLQQNKINNIQSIVQMNLQQLQTLGISFNQISQIRCFKKLSIASLNQIYLIQNPLAQILPLTTAKINKNKFQDLSLQYLSYQNPISQDLSILMKINSKLIQKLYITSTSRINQPKMQIILRQRFPFIEVHYKQQIHI